MNKRELRKEVLQKRDALSEAERSEKSKMIVQRILQENAFKQANKVLLFVNYKSEVETIEIYKAAVRLQKKVYYPKVIGSEMEFFAVESQEELIKGFKGILEPPENPKKVCKMESEDVVCMLMPGAVFDEAGNRIGYGGGYYDKYLSRFDPTRIQKLAVAYDCQIVSSGRIDFKMYDQRPNIIITENRIIRCEN